eukprot:scaffold7_cov414-Pavlova_lutheri.AAC.7
MEIKGSCHRYFGLVSFLKHSMGSILGSTRLPLKKVKWRTTTWNRRRNSHDGPRVTQSPWSTLTWPLEQNVPFVCLGEDRKRNVGALCSKVKCELRKARGKLWLDHRRQTEIVEEKVSSHPDLVGDPYNVEAYKTRYFAEFATSHTRLSA